MKRSIIFLILMLITLSFHLLLYQVFPRGLTHDGAAYEQIARSLADGQGYPVLDGRIWAPVYPFYLYLNYELFGYRLDIPKFIQFFFHGVIACLLYLLFHRLISSLPRLRYQNIWASLMALTVVFWPFLAFYVQVFGTETIYILSMTVFFYYLFRFLDKQTWRFGLISATALALATLTRPLPLFYPLWLFFLFFAASKIKLIDFRLDLKMSLILVAIFYLLLAPWTFYASKKMGEFVPINNYGASSLGTPDWEFYQTPGYEPGTEITTKKMLLSKVRNVYRFWKAGASGKDAQGLARDPWLALAINLYRWGFYLMLIPFFFSLKYIRKPEIFLMWSFILYTWALHVVIFPLPRYTLVLIPFVLCLAAYSLLRFGLWCLSARKKAAVVLE